MATRSGVVSTHSAGVQRHAVACLLRILLRMCGQLPGSLCRCQVQLLNPRHCPFRGASQEIETGCASNQSKDPETNRTVLDESGTWIGDPD